MTTHAHPQDVLRRHALPEVLFAPDIAIVLELPEPIAEEGARAGRFGHEFYVQGRVAVLRQDLLDALAARGEAADAHGKEILGARLRAIPHAPEERP